MSHNHTIYIIVTLNYFVSRTCLWEDKRNGHYCIFIGNAFAIWVLFSIHITLPIVYIVLYEWVDVAERQRSYLDVSPLETERKCCTVKAASGTVATQAETVQCNVASKQASELSRRAGRAETASGPRLRLGGRDSPVLPQPARAGNVARHAAPRRQCTSLLIKPDLLPCLPACLLCLQHYISYATPFIICIRTSLYSSCSTYS